MAKGFVVGSVVAKVGADIREFTSKMNTVKDMIQETSKMQFGGKGAAGLGAGLTAAGAGMMLAGAGMANGIKNIVKQTMEYGDATTKLKNMTGATGKEAGKLDEDMRSLFRDGFANSYNEAATAMARSRTYFQNTNNDVKDMAKNALLLNTAFEQIDPESALMATSRMTHAFKDLSGDEAFDLMLGTIQNSGADVAQTVEALNEYSHDFAMLGFDGKEMSDRIVYGMQNGAYSVDKITDLYREFQDRSADMSDDWIAHLQTMRFDQNEVVANLKAGGDKAKKQVDEIITAIGNTDDSILRRRMMDEMFGSIGTDLGDKFFMDYEKVGTQENKTDGSMDRMEKTLKDESLTFNVTALANSFKDLMVTIGSAYVPFLISAAKWMKMVIDGLNDFLKKHPTFTKILAWSMVVLTGVFWIVGALLTAFGGIMLFLAATGTKLSLVYSEARALVSMLSKDVWVWIKGKFGKFFGFFKKFFLGNFFKRILGPFSVVLLVVEAIYALVKWIFGEKVAKMVVQFLNPFTFLRNIFYDLKDTILNKMPAGLQTVAKIIFGIGEFIFKIITFIPQMFSNLVTGDTLNPAKIWKNIGSNGDQRINIFTNSLDSTNASSVGKRVGNELRSDSARVMM